MHTHCYSILLAIFHLNCHFLFIGGEALGVENGSIPDENITASSSAGPAPAHLARLNGPFAWCVGKAEDCYLQVRLILTMIKSGKCQKIGGIFLFQTLKFL